MIEGNDAISPESASRGLLSGLYKGEFMISTDFIGHVCRATSACALPWNNAVLDFIFCSLALVCFISCQCSEVDKQVIFPFFRRYADFLVFLEKRKMKKAVGEPSADKVQKSRSEKVDQGSPRKATGGSSANQRRGRSSEKA